MITNPAKVPPSLQSAHPVNDGNVSRASSPHSQQSNHISPRIAMPLVDCVKNVKEGVKGDIRKTSRGWGRPPQDIARIADELADEEEALSRSETDDSRSTHELCQPRH